jgi:hypothetical protein
LANVEILYKFLAAEILIIHCLSIREQDTETISADCSTVRLPAYNQLATGDMSLLGQERFSKRGKEVYYIVKGIDQ